MFYSQFILAKKGPLGTIWIAAHLERKLRKNQVADTDIGVSVDSILFPDVPIALRLSSHLLLGVVRIYSRKVNYLFDDCSEALLKIKQAFRSAAVDLPPEESTAPYHSITLPETFDLDDFELPDSDIFHGNYVDHHISAREQITLQDTMEGVVYSTSQFGLDERFGDGDTSRLDLDEELFLDNVTGPGQAGDMLASDMEAHLKQDCNQERPTENSQLLVAGVVNQVGQLAGGCDFSEYAQGPCTPGLVEEPNLSNIQEVSVCDDHIEPENHRLRELAVKDNLSNATSNSQLQHGNEDAVNWSLPNDVNSESVLCTSGLENEHHTNGKEINQAQAVSSSREPLEANSVVSEYMNGNISTFDGLNQVEDFDNGVCKNNELCSGSIEQIHLDRVDEPVSIPLFTHEISGLEVPSSEPCTSSENLAEKSCLSGTCDAVSDSVVNDHTTTCKPDLLNNSEISGNVEKPCPDSNAVVSNNEQCYQQHLHVHEETENSNILDSTVQEKRESSNMHILQPCGHMNQLDAPKPGVDESAPTGMPSEVMVLCLSQAPERTCEHHESGACIEPPEETHFVEPHSPAGILVDFSKSDAEDNIILGHTNLESLDRSIISELPAPERLLCDPEGLSNLPESLMADSTPYRANIESGIGDDAGTKLISGKKRSFTESTVTVQSLSSVESFEPVLSKRTKGSVPDDDDLLSSILVGRKCSVLKMKPTPPPSEITHMKRPRSAARMLASKRRVMMDGTMIVHGDIIRQQLTNTEDIRRLRKKAPCTRPEIWMIQKDLLEDEIFEEPIFTGLSAELVLMHSQSHDLSGISVYKSDACNASFKNEADLKIISEHGNGNSLGGAESSMMVPNIVEETETEVIDPSMFSRNNVEVDVDEPSVQSEKEQARDLDIFEGSYAQGQMETPSGVPEVPEPRCSGEQHLTDPSKIGIHRASNCLADGASPADYSSGPVLDDIDNSLRMDAIAVSQDQELGTLSFGTMTGSEQKAKDEFLLEETQADTTVETRAYFQTDLSSCTENANSSLATCSFEATGQGDHVVPFDQAVGDNWKDNHKVVNEVETLPAELNNNDMNPTLIDFHAEVKVDASIPVDCDVDVKILSTNDAEYHGCDETDPSMVVEITTTDNPVVEDHDFNYVDGHDTEFLNVDDDEAVEEDDDYMPNAEQASFVENSGWSSRTRAVAKYLQTLFDKEAVQGRKVLAMDNLLVGRTRKEASRMFFEALVLKTRDYIHAEQGIAFNNINLMPRGKLMKSDL